MSGKLSAYVGFGCSGGASRKSSAIRWYGSMLQCEYLGERLDHVRGGMEGQMSGRELHWSEVARLHDHLPSPPGSCSVEVLSLESRCVHATCKRFLPSLWQPGATEKVSRPASGRRLAGHHRREGVAARQPTGCSRCKSRVGMEKNYIIRLYLMGSA